MATKTRQERDSLGTVEVPIDALWGAQTQRAVINFEISGLTMPRAMIAALGLIKSTAAGVNAELGVLPHDHASAIQRAADAIAAGDYDDQFPLDIFQTGSGTSTNMNANEVIARLASDASELSIHPNDHVNLGQSSNDVIPTAIHVAAMLGLQQQLFPALEILEKVILDAAERHADVVKTGRTHLMDAMPIRLDQELGAWATQIKHVQDGLRACLPRLSQLAQGATAVGTGINAHPAFAARFVAALNQRTGCQFAVADNHFERLACQDSAVELSGQFKTLAVALMKISNDLRWMNSGPLAGLGEIQLRALQPGSSIMPGKVNPVIPEAVCMVAAQVIGNDAAITVGGQSGNFQLNVMLPMIAFNLLQSLEILSNASQALAADAIADFEPQHERLEEVLARNPVLVTALNAAIGYDAGAKIAKQAWTEQRPVLEVALEQTNMSRAELTRLLDPKKLTKGGIVT